MKVPLDISLKKGVYLLMVLLHTCNLRHRRVTYTFPTRSYSIITIDSAILLFRPLASTCMYIKELQNREYFLQLQG